MKKKTDKPRFLLPAVLMLSAALVAASALKPRTLLETAAAGDTRMITLRANAGDFSLTAVTASGGEVTISAENNETNVTSAQNAYNLSLTNADTITLSCDNDFTSLTFDNGADEITDIDAADSGLTSITVTPCTNLESLNLSGTNVSTLNLTGLTSLSSIDLTNCPITSFNAVTGCDTLTNWKDLIIDTSLSLPNATATVSDGKASYTISDSVGDSANYEVTVSDEDGDTPFQNVTQSGSTFTVPCEDIFKGSTDVASAKLFCELYPTDDHPSILAFHFDLTVNNPDYKDPEKQPEDTDDPDDTDDTDDTDETPYRAITVNKDSTSIIDSAYIENVQIEGVDLSTLQVIAKAPAAADKKAFLEAIKKSDKDFNADDTNLMVYDIYVADKDGKKVSIKGKTALLAVLKYPAAVAKHPDEYTFKVYHQQEDKTIDTSPNLFAEENGLQMVTDSCSLFAISCTPDPIEYTDLTIDTNSKKIILAASIDKEASLTLDGDPIELKDVRIVAKALSAADKKTFLAAIKKADKNFDPDDKNLLVYDIYLADKDDHKVSTDKTVKFKLAYPSEAIQKDKDKYAFKVYHQLGETIETTIVPSAVKDGIEVPARDFSPYAVSTTLKSTGSPATGESQTALYIALVLAMLSLASGAATIVKSKSEQY